MFDEFFMANPGPLASYVGFTETEVRQLCSIYDMDFEEIKRWYDGYCFENSLHIYSPRSVVSAMLTQSLDNFGNKTETFEALRAYISLNYDGLKDSDIVYIPRKNHPEKPAFIVELKWNKAAKGAISQIKDKCYVKSLENYIGNILLVGINHNSKTKEHHCRIEKLSKTN